MPGQIFNIDNSGKLLSMKESQYDSESVLQQILSSYPELLAGDQIDPDDPRQWILVSREVRIPGNEEEGGRWSLDHLFLDQDGIPTLIEVKRSNDTRIRREVVGQMMDYAANAILYWPVDNLRTLFEENCEKLKQDFNEIFSNTFGEELDYEKYWQDVKENLQSGRIRLLFVADDIPEELQTVIEFLNDQMERAQVLGVSIKQFSGQNMKTLVPRLVGQTSAARAKKQSSKGAHWNEDSFFKDMEKKATTVQIKTAQAILSWAKSQSLRIWFGSGKRNGSFVPCLDYNGTKNQLFSVWSDGSIEFYFYWYTNKKPFDSEKMRMELLQKINECSSQKIPAAGINRRPSIDLSALSKPDSLQSFEKVYEWFLEQIKENN